MREQPEITDEEAETELSAPAYQATSTSDIPAKWSHLRRTQFLVAEQPVGTDALVIVPGWALSVKKVPIDKLFVTSSTPRYSRIVTHHSINYPTQHEFLISQYAAVLLQLLEQLSPAARINFLGLSIGGSTLVQFLAHAQEFQPKLFERFGTAITIGTPVTADDLTLQWQEIVYPACQVIALAQRKRLAENGLLDRARKLASRALLKAVHMRTGEHELEVETPDEAASVFAYAAEAYRSASDVQPGSLNMPIHSIGFTEDTIGRNTEASRFGIPETSSHTVIEGAHDRYFYDRSKDEIDRLLLTHLG